MTLKILGADQLCQKSKHTMKHPGITHKILHSPANRSGLFCVLLSENVPPVSLTRVNNKIVKKSLSIIYKATILPAVKPALQLLNTFCSMGKRPYEITILTPPLRRGIERRSLHKMTIPLKTTLENILYLYPHSKRNSMKKLIICTVMACLSFAGNAQQTIFKEDFTHMPGLGLSFGWTNVSPTSVGWRTSDMYDLFCSYSVIPQYKFFDKVAAVSGCYGKIGGPRNNSNVLAYTPGIDLRNEKNGVVLKFDSYFNRMNKDLKFERATVEVSINDGASWTPVLEVPGGEPDSFTTHYINLSQYQGYGNVRIGFRYSDQGVDQKFGGWAIDNVEVYRPAKFDMALTSFFPEDELSGYQAINQTITHYGTVRNMGLDTIHSFTLKYRRDNGYDLADVVNVTVPPLAAYNFVHAVPDTINKIGKINITASVDVAGDANPANNTLTHVVHGAHFMPDKKVLVEEGTGTWNTFGPRGLVYMKDIADNYDACLVSIHSTDPMAMDAYSDYLYNLKFYTPQYFLLDRQFVDPAEFHKRFEKFNKHFGFADIHVVGGIYLNRIEIEATVKPAIDMTGDFRIMMVITEDDISENKVGYEQKNGYANGERGPMGGYESKGDPIPSNELEYDHVARFITPAPDGRKTFTTELKHGVEYKNTFNIAIDENWNRSRLRAIVMLYNNTDTMILNSSQVLYFLDVDNPLAEEAISGIYPNPANDFTMLEFDAKESGTANIYVTDMRGVTVAALPPALTDMGRNKVKIETGRLPDGLYIINLRTETEHRALKLQVLH